MKSVNLLSHIGTGVLQHFSLSATVGQQVGPDHLAKKEWLSGIRAIHAMLAAAIKRRLKREASGFSEQAITVIGDNELARYR